MRDQSGLFPDYNKFQLSGAGKREVSDDLLFRHDVVVVMA